MARTSVTTEQVEALLAERWGRSVQLSAVAAGLDSQVFGFSVQEDNYVIRVNRSPAGFEKDRFVFQTFASAALPIPEVHEIGWLDQEHAFCISRRAPGIRLLEADPAVLIPLTPSLVEVMDSLARAEVRMTRGYGPFDATGQAPYPSWHTFVLSIRDPARYALKRVEALVGRDLIMAMVEEIEALVPICPEERRLIHGDFGSNNLLTDGQSVTAVIDWDRAMLGDPLYDSANLLFWQEARLGPLLHHLYEQSAAIAHGYERLRCYQLRIGLQELYESAIGTGPIALAWLRERCQTLVQHPGGTTTED